MTREELGKEGILCQASAPTSGEASSREGALQSGVGAEARKKITLRGAPGGYDVFVGGTTPSEAKIGHVRKTRSRPVEWEVIRNGTVIHKSSRTQRHAVAVLISAWESQIEEQAKRSDDASPQVQQGPDTHYSL